ncbi:MAG TPA: ABC transporter permease [Dehalococcoidia bacterium]|nr:ABC transporter permease [Dehalococcoidia bacterium]
MAGSEAAAALPEFIPASVHDLPAGRRVLIRTARFMRKRKLGAFGVVLVIVVLVAAILSPVLQRYDDNRQFVVRNPSYQAAPSGGGNILAQLQAGKTANDVSEFVTQRFESPNGAHWLGTDSFGRDIYARIIVGARLAALIGIFASLIAVTTGTLCGVISGYFGGLVDLVVQRVVDGVQAFPALVLLLLIVQVFKTPPLWVTIAALGFLGWATSVRVVRSAVLSVREQPFIEAARSCGATDIRLMLAHVLPNVVAVILILFSIGIGAYILAEAALSFLGLGPQGVTTWGKMVEAGRNGLDLHPWESLFSGAAITIAVLGFNLAGDALRDELDPRLRGR